MFNRVLVPLDGSILAERALAPALALGRHSGGEVILLRVPIPEKLLVFTSAGYGLLWPDEAVERSQNEAWDYLTSIHKANEQPTFKLRTEVNEGDVAGVIVDTALRDEVDMISMSTHGHSGITRWVLGSVTERVLRSAPCPVLVIRSPQPLRQILIPLDGSALAEHALAPGLELARSLGGEMTLLHAVEPPDAGETEHLEQIERGLGRRLREDFYKGVEAHLRDLAAAHQQAGLNIRTVVKDGPAADSILEFAEAHGMDVIVMATHGRTGLRRWVYGSVTEKVLRGAACSLLVIRPPARKLLENLNRESRVIQ